MHFSRDLLHFKMSTWEICAHMCPYMASCFIISGSCLLLSRRAMNKCPMAGCWWECRDYFVWDRVCLYPHLFYGEEQGACFPEIFPKVLCKRPLWKFQMFGMIVSSSGARSWTSSQMLWVTRSLLLQSTIYLQSNLELIASLYSVPPFLWLLQLRRRDWEAVTIWYLKNVTWWNLWSKN